MSPELRQFKLLHGVLIPDFLVSLGIEPTSDAVLQTKEIIKKYLHVRKTSKLTTNQMSRFIAAFCMLAAREFSVEIPIRDAERTMTEILDLTTRKYEQENKG